MHHSTTHTARADVLVDALSIHTRVSAALHFIVIVLGMSVIVGCGADLDPDSAGDQGGPTGVAVDEQGSLVPDSNDGKVADELDDEAAGDAPAGGTVLSHRWWDLDRDGYMRRIDCNDRDATVHPGAAEVCGDGIDQNCDGADLPCLVCADADSDGATDADCGGADCDDADATVRPGASERCGDGVDQDCNGTDPLCLSCTEGGVPSTGCTCGGATRTSGYCCAGAWQQTGCSSVTILWQDGIQSSASAPWGFNTVQVERPIGTTVAIDNDANGVSLLRVADPLGGGGHALRQLATFDGGGSRNQLGLWSFANPAFAAQATSAEGIYVAQQWYFPQAVGAGGDLWPWINLWDWHSTDAGGANRWHTSPGLMLAEDGSMRVRWEWSGSSGNSASADSTIAMPVGEWFDVEMFYRWSTTGTTLRLWINGELALEQSGVRTRASSHQNIETYVKWYGSDQGRTRWSPSPTLRYVRNVRFAASRVVP